MSSSTRRRSAAFGTGRTLHLHMFNRSKTFWKFLGCVFSRPIYLLLALLLACCCLWTAYLILVAPSEPTGLKQVTALQKGHSESHYNVNDGYWQLTVNHSFPAVSLLSRSGYIMVNSSCWDIAKAHREPYSEEYKLKNRQASNLPGGAPRAFWKWQGRISRKLFDSVPFILREASIAGGCQHCTFVLRYKVLNGHLYTDKRRRHRALDGQEEEVNILEELLLATLHTHKVPDVDFLLHLGDGSPAGLPLVQVNVNRSHHQAGFTLPKFMWRDALGPAQLIVLTECLQARYPTTPHLHQRIPRAVWRGGSTDSRVWLMDESNVLQVMRTRLHMFGLWYPDTFDAHYTAFPQQAFDTHCVEELLPPGPSMPLEEFNKYALVLDIDGNGWSDRFRLLSHFNTPVLKQASNLTAFFEHLMAPGDVIEQYSPGLSDLPVRARALLEELQRAPARLVRMAERQQGLAHALLNQLALMQATAYTLHKVSELSDWKPVAESDYELVPFNKCCSYAQQLPKEFIQAVQDHHSVQFERKT